MTVNHDRLESIFFAALQISAAVDRQRYIDHACDQDSALRCRILELLDNHHQAGSFLGPTVTFSGDDGQHTSI